MVCFAVLADCLNCNIPYNSRYILTISKSMPKSYKTHAKKTCSVLYKTILHC